MKKFKRGKTAHQRSPTYGVGKAIGGKIYVHKNYALRKLKMRKLKYDETKIHFGWNVCPFEAP